MDNIKPEEIDDIIKKVLHDKLTHYISGKVTSELTRLHHGNKKTAVKKEVKELKEEESTNSVGASSSTSGTGPIDTFDPILNIKKKLAKRKLSNGINSSQKA